jgi:putative spermidine/putrescine transport system ATP-binding protein
VSGAEIRLDHLSKNYGIVAAVRDVSLVVEPGEFLALLGPSGSGKSTILSMIAGFERPSGGEILVGGQPMSQLPPHRRDIGMVFQRYALFPHLTVGENLAYPLRRRGLSDTAVAAEVTRTLAVIQLEGRGARYPHELSGGQQQRVALGRAIIFRPPLLLMDEPLGALDKKLRQQMQLELKLLHRSLGTTIILVTHDQEEALSMAGRVAVLDGGRLQQVDTPARLYQQPQTAFVAGFIGEMNFLGGIVAEVRGEEIGVRCADCPSLGVLQIPRASLPAGVVPAAGDAVTLAIRPEHLELRVGGPARVIESAYAGSTHIVLAQLDRARVVVRVPTTADGAWTTGVPVDLVFQASCCRLYPGAPPEGAIAYGQAT